VRPGTDVGQRIEYSEHVVAVEGKVGHPLVPSPKHEVIVVGCPTVRKMAFPDRAEPRAPFEVAENQV
jgi:hypothetical protein